MLGLISVEYPKHRCSSWLLLGALWALPGCTLTSEAYEPGLVEGVEADLERVGDGAGLPPVQTETSAFPVADDGEGGFEEVPLDPGGADELASAPVRPVDVGSGDVGSADAGVDPGEADPSEPDPSEPDLATPTLPAEPSTPTEPSIPAEPCPSLVFGGSCYQPFAELVTWAVAEQRCVAWGGHLAIIETLEEDAFLEDWPAELGIFTVDGSGIWIGATDAAFEGRFQWWDDTPVTTDGWAPNQPDNGAGADCIEKRNDGTARWFDQRCDDSHRYLCERPL